MQKFEVLKEQRDKLRIEWRDVRDRRLILKKSYSNTKNCFQSGTLKRDYMILKKRQKKLSKLIKHVEKKMNREIDGARKN